MFTSIVIGIQLVPFSVNRQINVSSVCKIVYSARTLKYVKNVMQKKIFMKKMENVDTVTKQKINLLLTGNVKYAQLRDA